MSNGGKKMNQTNRPTQTSKTKNYLNIYLGYENTPSYLIVRKFIKA